MIHATTKDEDAQALTSYLLATLAARSVYGARYESDTAWLDRLRDHVARHLPDAMAAAMADVIVVDSTARKMLAS